MAPRRIVVDTQVILDLWVFGDPRVTWLDRLLRDRAVHALRTAASDFELADVLSRPNILQRARGRALGDAKQVIDQWHRSAELFHAPTSAAPWVCRDADDQKFLDLAFTAGADYLLTRDKALLCLDRRSRLSGLRIRQPELAAMEIGGVCV